VVRPGCGNRLWFLPPINPDVASETQRYRARVPAQGVADSTGED